MRNEEDAGFITKMDGFTIWFTIHPGNLTYLWKATMPVKTLKKDHVP